MHTVKHPEEGPDGFKLVALVFDGGVGEAAVGLLERDGRKMMALRWCPGTDQIAVWPGEETGWFLIPFTFAIAIGRMLSEMKAAHHPSIDPRGFEVMVQWLVEVEGLNDAMCY